MTLIINSWLYLISIPISCLTVMFNCHVLLITAGQDIDGEVEHPEERGEDREDGVEHRAHPSVVGQQMQKTKVGLRNKFQSG